MGVSTKSHRPGSSGAPLPLRPSNSAPKRTGLTRPGLLARFRPKRARGLLTHPNMSWVSTPRKDGLSTSLWNSSKARLQALLDDGILSRCRPFCASWNKHAAPPVAHERNVVQRDIKPPT